MSAPPEDKPPPIYAMITGHRPNKLGGYKTPNATQTAIRAQLHGENGAVVLCEDIGPPQTIHKTAQYATAADLLRACDTAPNEHGDNGLYGLPPHLLNIQWETTMPNRFKRPPGPTEMIPDYVNAHYDTIGPKTFDRPVMLSFGCEKHPVHGNHAVFDVMVTWAQIEELEAAIERVRKQCAFESPVASVETSEYDKPQTPVIYLWPGSPITSPNGTIYIVERVQDDGGVLFTNGTWAYADTLATWGAVACKPPETGAAEKETSE